VKTFKIGEYLVKAGEKPEGLFLISKGRVKVCAEKLAMRTSAPSHFERFQPRLPNMKVGLTEHKAPERPRPYYSDSFQQINFKNKTFHNESILVDDNGQRIKDYLVYKDLVSLLFIFYF